jgi:hypothetical protein
MASHWIKSFDAKRTTVRMTSVPRVDIQQRFSLLRLIKGPLRRMTDFLLVPARGNREKYRDSVAESPVIGGAS